MLPYSLLNKYNDIYPLFGKRQLHSIASLPMGNNSEWMQNLTDQEIADQNVFNDLILEFKRETKADIIASGFLENRERMFRCLGFDQMVKQGRFFHLGLDLTVSVGATLYAPLDGEVYLSEYEEGSGNYGGVIVLQHRLGEQYLYSVYGHQNKDSLPQKGTFIHKGEQLSEIGDFSSNGGYFHHVHLQLLTQKGVENGYIFRGYETHGGLEKLDEYVIDPSYLFRYS